MKKKSVKFKENSRKNQYADAFRHERESKKLSNKKPGLMLPGASQRATKAMSKLTEFVVKVVRSATRFFLLPA